MQSTQQKNDNKKNGIICICVFIILGIECSWERHSNKSGDGLSTNSVTSNTSELSVACLQEKIFRMEESQYR